MIFPGPQSYCHRVLWLDPGAAPSEAGCLGTLASFVSEVSSDLMVARLEGPVGSCSTFTLALGTVSESVYNCYL